MSQSVYRTKILIKASRMATYSAFDYHVSMFLLILSAFLNTLLQISFGADQSFPWALVHLQAYLVAPAAQQIEAEWVIVPQCDGSV